MKRANFYISAFLGLVISCSFPNFAFSQSVNPISKKEATKWYNKKEWLNGINRNSHKSINKEEFAKQYNAHKERWDKAFAYLKETDLENLTPGRYPVDGDNLYVIVTQAATRDADTVLYEAHKNYADIHWVIKGQEKMGVAPFSTAVIKKEYDPIKEIAFYNANGKFYIADTSNFFIFFAQKDAHRPSVQVNRFDVDKKIVVKIRTND